jgi:hypothetical protein
VVSAADPLRSLISVFYTGCNSTLLVNGLAPVAWNGRLIGELEKI